MPSSRRGSAAMVCALMVATPPAAQAAEVIDYAEFAPPVATLRLNSVDTVYVVDDAGRKVLRLLPSVNPGSQRRGGACHLTPVAIDRGFSSFFAFRLSQPQGLANQPLDIDEVRGADGFAFVVHRDPRGSGALGPGAGGLGYGSADGAAATAIRQSVAVELDTYSHALVNPADALSGMGDRGDHVGIDVDGSTTSAAAVALSPDGGPYVSLQDGDVRYAWVDYDGTTLEVRLASTPSRPLVPLLAHPVDLQAILGASSGFFAFTAGTGVYVAHHDVLEWHVREGYEPFGVILPPRIDLLSPPLNFVTPAPQVAVAGVVTPATGVTVRMVDMLGALHTPNVDLGGVFNQNVDLVEGPNILLVSAVDAGGESGGTSFVVTRDSQPPVVAVSPPSGTVVGASPIAVSVTVTDATTTWIELDRTAVAPPGGAVFLADLALEPGANTFAVKVTDAAGHVVTETLTYTLDEAAPAVTIDAPEGGAFVGESPIAVTATIDDDSATQVTSSPAGLAGEVAAGGGSLTGAVTLVEGGNIISVTAVDAQGRSGTGSVSVVLDTRPPIAIVVSPGGGAVRETIDLAAVAEDPAGSGVASVVLSVDGAAVANLAAPPYVTSVDTRLLVDGLHAFEVRAEDALGHVTNDSINARVDNTPPAVAIVAPSAGARVAGTILFAVPATDGGAGLTEVRLRAGGAPPTEDPSTEYTQVPAAFLTAAVDTTAFPDGPLLLEATATDAAGNQTRVETTVVVDNTPAARLIFRPSDGQLVEGTIAIEVGTADDLGIEVFVDGQPVGAAASGPLLLEVDSAVRLDGAMTIAARARDLAGNLASDLVSVVVDNVELRIAPSRFVLSDRVRGRDVAAVLEGPEPAIDRIMEADGLRLLVPGGNPVPLALVRESRRRMKAVVTREAVDASARVGIATGMIQPGVPVALTVEAGPSPGAAIGSALVTFVER